MRQFIPVTQIVIGADGNEAMRLHIHVNVNKIVTFNARSLGGAVLHMDDHHNGSYIVTAETYAEIEAMVSR